jgi:hypothetical protein
MLLRRNGDRLGGENAKRWVTEDGTSRDNAVVPFATFEKQNTDGWVGTQSIRKHTPSCSS